MAKKTQCYCAFCKSPRAVYKEKSIRLRHVFWSFLFSIALSFAIWREYEPKSFLFFVVGMMLAEVFLKIRWRLHMTCHACGFDPVAYLKDPEKAAERVKIFLERRQNDPASLFKKPLNLPTRKEPAKAPKPAKSLSTRV